MLVTDAPVQQRQLYFYSIRSNHKHHDHRDLATGEISYSDYIYDLRSIHQPAPDIWFFTAAARAIGYGINTP